MGIVLERCCAAYTARTMDVSFLKALKESIRRMVWDELQIFVTDDDLSYENLSLITIEEWKKTDPALASLEDDGTYLSDSYLGVHNRNRLLCVEYRVPRYSTSGSLIYISSGYAEPKTANRWGWIPLRRNE